MLRCKERVLYGFIEIAAAVLTFYFTVVNKFPVETRLDFERVRNRLRSNRCRSLHFRQRSRQHRKRFNAGVTNASAMVGLKFFFEEPRADDASDARYRHHRRARRVFRRQQLRRSEKLAKRGIVVRKGHGYARDASAETVPTAP